MSRYVTIADYHDSVDAHGNDQASAGGHVNALRQQAAVHPEHGYVWLRDGRGDRDHATNAQDDNGRPGDSDHGASDHGRYRNFSYFWWHALPHSG